MDCTLVYKNKDYTHDEFFKYIDEHPDEFKAKEAQYQLKGTESSKASPKVIKIVKEFLERQGFKIDTFNNILDSQGNKLDANAVTNIMTRLIEVVEGKEATSLPEEAMHVVTRILKDKNPEIFKEMMNKVASYNIFGDVMAQYKDNKDYQIDGKPNVPKIKEEAVGKILAEYVIKGAEEGKTEKPELIERTQSWWNRIKEFLSALFTKEHFNPFKTVAKEFLKGNTEGNPNVDGNGVYYQANNIIDIGKKIFDAIKGENRVIKTTDAAGNSKYETFKDNGEKVKVAKRVTDYPKAIYEEAFKNKTLSEQDIASFEIDKSSGTRLHGYNEDILERYIDKGTGLKRDVPINKTLVTTGEDHIYGKLEEYIKNVIDRFPQNTRFIFEQPLYKSGKRPGVEDLAGTIDFLALTPDGVAYNLDWKFMNDKGRQDITRLTQKAHRSQMGWYGTMLRDYGVKDIRESNTIPMKLVYKHESGKQKELTDIVLGDPKYINIVDKTLLPIPSRQTQVGIGAVEDKKMTSFVKQLNAMLEQMELMPTKGNEWMIKEQKINHLSSAIRQLLVKRDVDELINFSKQYVDSKVNYIKSVQALIKAGNKENLTKEEINNLGYELIEANITAETFEGLNNTLIQYLKEMAPEDREKAKETLNSISDRATYIRKSIFDKKTKEGIVADLSDVIGRRSGVYNILASEKNVKVLAKMFNTLSAARTKTTQALYPLIHNSLGVADLKWKDESKKLSEHKDAIISWMGGSWSKEGKDKLLKLVFQKDSKGGWKPQLVGKYSKEFYKELDSRKTSNTQEDRKWIEANIDQEAYKKEYERYLQDVIIPNANERVFDFRDSQNDKNLREQYIENHKNTFDITRPTAFTKGNFLLGRFPSKENYSSEYKQMSSPGNEAVKSFYEYIHGQNRRAHDIGLMGSYYGTFFAQMRRGIVESLTHGLDAKSAVKQLASGFITEPGEHGYIDPITNEPQDRIAASYMHDLGEEIKNDKGEVVGRDYSGVSDDIFKVMELFNGEMLKYEALTSVEGHMKLLKTLEEGKDALVVYKGKLVKDSEGRLQTTGNNEANMDYFNNYVKHAIYGRKHTGDDLGFNFEYKDKDYHFSIPKAIDSINRYVSLKALGLNPMSALSNLFGGTANSYINSGKHITKGDLAEGMSMVIQGKFMTGDGAKFVKLLDHFVPFTESLGRELGKHMTMNQVQRYLSSDGLMTFLRKTDNAVEGMNSHAFFKNTMIENGKLVNIREYVRNQMGYDKIFNLSTPERKNLLTKIDNEISRLQKERNLYNDKNIIFDEKGVKLPGIARYSQSEIDVRNRIQQLTRDSLGNRTPEELAQINMTLFGGSAMMFKNWIPRLAQKRFADFAFTPGAETYEMGRIRMLGSALRGGVMEKLTGLKNLISYAANVGGEQSLINIAKKEYTRRVQQQRELEQVSEGESMFEKTVSESDFVDQYLRGVKAQMRELGATISLFALFGVAASHATQDDDYQTKGMWKWSVRMLDKFSNELGFFYSPNSFKQLVGNGGIPAMSLLMDIENFMVHGTREVWYDLDNNEDAAAKNKVLKYPLRNTLGINQFIYYFSLFDEDMAKDLGIQPKANIPVVNTN